MDGGRHRGHPDHRGRARRPAGRGSGAARQGGAGRQAEGDAEGALQAAKRQQKTTRENGLLLLEADASELAAAALVTLERWAEARDEASAAIAFCEETSYRNLLWRLLARRAAAHAGLGDDKAARADRAAAEALLEQLVEAIPTDAWKATFLAQPLAKEALG